MIECKSDVANRNAAQNMNATNADSKNKTGISVDAVALQERDEFRADGWVKVISPAKVNLHLAIGEKRADGYHEAATVMQALNLHDVVYVRRAIEQAAQCRMVPLGDIVLPEIPAADNLAMKAVARLAEALSLSADAARVDIRIEKNIPAQAGLGGGSSNAAAALLGAAELWGVSASDPALESVARTLGADVAFFLHGGCAYLEGTGDTFVHALAPSKRCVALVKPDGGVSTAAAYRQFDAQPVFASEERANHVRTAKEADEIELFNNLAPASEALMPQLKDVRTWLLGLPQVEDALLSGSGATTFAVCGSFDAACSVVAAARERGWWARSTSFGSIRAAVVSKQSKGGTA